LKKILLFGAGKIGRSFIGQLFSLGGYEVTFVDVNRDIINALNHRRSYDVVIKSDHGTEVLHISPVYGLHSSQEEEIFEAIDATNLVATSVGPVNLPHVLDILGRGLKKKFDTNPDAKVDIIIAENLRNASDFFTGHLKKFISEQIIHNRLGLVETSIGKMVPIMTMEEMQQDILRVFAEPYNTLILDRLGFKNPLPAVEGLAPKTNMKAWVDRKSFIHNLGHAVSAYIGYLKHPDYPYLYQVLADRNVYEFTRSAMTEAAAVMISLYPSEFSKESLEEHITDLLERFQNRALGDTVHRVGRDLFRKLGPEDRLAGAIRLALRTGDAYDHILYALVCGYYFRAPDESSHMFPDDKDFARFVSENDFRISFEKVSKFNSKEHETIIRKAMEMNQRIRKELNI
jgi:mannitol-1-phosphate 5-dehydrogenase